MRKNDSGCEAEPRWFCALMRLKKVSDKSAENVVSDVGTLVLTDKNRSETLFSFSRSLYHKSTPPGSSTALGRYVN